MESELQKKLQNKYNLKTYSDLAKVSNQLSFGAESDFFAREDGYDAICDDYGMNFKDTMDLDVSIKYDAVKQGQVDVIDVYTTDGRLENSNIVVLEDDKDFLSFLLCRNSNKSANFNRSS